MLCRPHAPARLWRYGALKSLVCFVRGAARRDANANVGCWSGLVVKFCRAGGLIDWECKTNGERGHALVSLKNVHGANVHHLLCICWS